MREDICSIPISEIFEPKDGCPFCRMRDMLEDRMATYITGAAMMEPDVRVETNRLGFCHQHFEQILQRGSRLSVALILESLLDEAGKEILPEDDKLAAALAVNKNRRIERGDLFLRGVFVNGIHREKHGVFGVARDVFVFVAHVQDHAVRLGIDDLLCFLKRNLFI